MDNNDDDNNDDKNLDIGLFEVLWTLFGLGVFRQIYPNLFEGFGYFL